VPTGQYRLCFDAREVPGFREVLGGTASFTLTVELLFYDELGNFIAGETESWSTAQIPDNGFQNFCLNAIAPEEAREALVRFNFEPNALNTSAVVIDNVKLECLRVQNQFFEPAF
jgi:hypothetical protein